jgi:CTP:phosphocholine cytidylyltransferase-like protein
MQSNIIYGELVVRKVRCINNKHFEKFLTIGKEYVSGNDFLEDCYVIEESDTGATKQVFDRKLFEVVE